MSVQEGPTISFSKDSLELWDNEIGEVEVTYTGSGTLAVSEFSSRVSEATLSEFVDGKATLTVSKVAFGDAYVTLSDGTDSATLPITWKGSWSYTYSYEGQEYTGQVSGPDDILALAAANGACVTLNRDLPKQNSSYAKTSDGELPVTIDLAGHKYGRMEIKSGSEVVLTSSAEGAELTGDIENATTTPLCLNHSGTGKLTVSNIGINCTKANATKNFQLISNSAAGELILDGVDISYEGSPTKSATGISVTNGTVTLNGGSLSIKQNNTGKINSTGVNVSGSGKVIARNANVSIDNKGTGTLIRAASSACAPEDAYSIDFEGCTIDVKTVATKASGIIAVDTTSGTPAKAGKVRAQDCTITIASTSEDKSEVFAVDGRSATAPTLIELGGNTVLESNGRADIALSAVNLLSLAPDFVASAESVSILCPGVMTDDVFATAADGGDAAAMAAAFVPAADDENYTGKVAEADGQTLKWAKPKIAVPEAVTDLTYTGEEQVGVTAGDGYNVTEGSRATDAGIHTATVALADGENTTWADGSTEAKTVEWSIAKAPLTATYAGEEIVEGEDPALKVDVAGFVGGETSETAADYDAPTLAKPEALEGGKSYELTPAGGSAKNYEFSYVAGILKVNAAPIPVAVPTAKAGLNYNGKEQVGVAEADGYTVTGGSATKPGSYTAKATLKDGYVWGDGTSGLKEIPWSIAAAKATAPSAKSGLVYNGKAQTGVSAGTGYTLSGTASATDAGSYTATAKLAEGYAWADGTTADKAVKWSIAKAKATVPAGKTLTYNGKKQTGVASGKGYTLKGNTATNGGSYKATATLAKNYQWSDGSTKAKTVAWKINAAKQTVTAKAKKATLKAKNLKKKAQAVKASVVKKGNSAKTAITYSKVKASKKAKYFTVAKDGKITVKKGLGKGTYKVTVKATAKATANYKAASKNFVVTITVK